MTLCEFKQLMDLSFPVLAIIDDTEHNVVSVTITVYRKVIAEAFTYDEISDNKVLMIRLNAIELRVSRQLRQQFNTIGRSKSDV